MDNIISKEKDENEAMDWNEIFGQEHEEEEIYCTKCLKIPKYTIVIKKNKIIQLSHKCKEKEENIYFPFEKKSNSYLPLKCYYCENKTSDICLECKQYICKMCQNEHISNLTDEDIISFNLVGLKLKEEEINYICIDKEMQFFCNEHFIQYQYFCPYCEKNLCNHCKNFHVHINCQSLFNCAQIKNIKIAHSNSSDEFIINLNKLSELFKNSYNRNYNQNKMSLNILQNYSLIEGINELIKNYIKNKILKKNKIILSNILNNEKEENIMCNCFYDDKFKKIYSELIMQAIKGNYEYHHKLKVLQQFYIYKNKFNSEIYLDEYNFINSLKGQIYQLKYIFISLKDKLSTINMQIRMNYLNKEISNLKLYINTLDVDIHLLKQINMNLLLKYNYQLRRKTGNFISELILKNYSEQLDIKENNYILMESIIQIRKKILESNELEGPMKELTDYKNKLKTKYEELLKLSNGEILSQLEKLRKNELKLESLDDEVNIRIKPKNNDDWKEVTVLNLFFIIKQKYRIVFNDNIHNRTEIVNIQLIDKLKKINEVSSKGNEQVKINGNKINGSKIDIKNINIKNKKCPNHFKIFNELKDYFGIYKNYVIEEKKNILELITYPDDSKTKVDVDDYKSKLDNIFKNYEFEDSIDFKNASKLYLKGEIIDILSEKKVYQNINKIINEMNQIDLEKIKKEILTDIENIEPELNKNIEEIEDHKLFLFNQINEVKKYISFENKAKKENLHNPFKFLQKLEKYNLNSVNDEKIKNLYMIYLVNLYFCAEQICEYFNILKEKYSDIKMINFQERNIEKSKLIKAFDSTINYEEPDTFTEIWNQLKKEDILDKNNNDLNIKIKEYIMNNNEKTFLKDLNDITKLKNKKIELWKSDPQYLTVKAYWYLKGIPLEIPSTLKRK